MTEAALGEQTCATRRLLIGRLLRCAARCFRLAARRSPRRRPRPASRAELLRPDAAPGYISQPDGRQRLYVGLWLRQRARARIPACDHHRRSCPTMQLPGPTLIVNQGDTVTVTLTNNLPRPRAIPRSCFPGFTVTATGGVPGLLTQEAANGGTVTYTFAAASPAPIPTTAARRATCRSRWACTAR